MNPEPLNWLYIFLNWLAIALAMMLAIRLINRKGTK